MGNVGVLIRAYAYLRMLGKENLGRISDYAVLNANYLLRGMQAIGYTPAFAARKATHEFIITLSPELAQHDISALHLAKNLLDYDIHPPTVYFPIQIPEALLFEPTETESKNAIDRVLYALKNIKQQMATDADKLKEAPHHHPTTRLDEARAAHPKHLDIRHQQS